MAVAAPFQSPCITRLWSLPVQPQSPAHCLQQFEQLLLCCRYTGSLYVAAAGTYTFQLDTIQGAQLWVNDQLLIDQAGELILQLDEHAVEEAVQGSVAACAPQGV